MTPCKHCGNTPHAIQYIAHAYTKKDGVIVPARNAVCLWCPQCDSASVSAKP